MNEGVIFWLICAAILGIAEAATVNLVTVWGAIAAVIAAVCAALGVGGFAQITVFVVLSGVLLILTKPFVKRVMLKNTVPTNADRIIGAEGIVTERIEPLENKGQIKVLGQIWSAKSESGEPIEVGSTVLVSALDGVKAVVAKKSLTKESDTQAKCV